jgi:ATPase subunit of ABC transporter with duplicated ATPase domains
LRGFLLKEDLKPAAGYLAPQSGTVQLHPQVKIGYFAQELVNLDLDETILDSLLRLPEITQSQARTIMGCFLFPREDANNGCANGNNHLE